MDRFDFRKPVDRPEDCFWSKNTLEHLPDGAFEKQHKSKKNSVEFQRKNDQQRKIETKKFRKRSAHKSKIDNLAVESAECPANNLWL